MGINSLHLLMIHGKSVRFFRQRIPCEWFCCAHGNCNQLPLIPGFVVLHGNCNQFPLIPLGLNCYERKCVAPIYKTFFFFFYDSIKKVIISGIPTCFHNTHYLL
uniref:Uncharacterized protein n=1 Tax=Cacopsylla melanoneura TaxID=428564 RepID=A0A8D9DN03_9HEMI